jgi:hypothetical protein
VRSRSSTKIRSRRRGSTLSWCTTSWRCCRTLLTPRSWGSTSS